MLGLMLSHDPALNMACEIHARMIVHKWEVILLALRTKEAMGAMWRRSCWWLSLLQGRETAAQWGHLGDAMEILQGSNGPTLFKTRPYRWQPRRGLGTAHLGTARWKCMRLEAKMKTDPGSAPPRRSRNGSAGCAA